MYVNSGKQIGRNTHAIQKLWCALAYVTDEFEINQLNGQAATASSVYDYVAYSPSIMAAISAIEPLGASAGAITLHIITDPYV